MSALAFHHLGLLTDQPVVAARRLQRAGYAIDTAVFDPVQGATVQLCTEPSGNGTVELITPAATNAALAKLLLRRGDYMYHVCFEVENHEAGRAALEAEGCERVIEVSPPREAVLFAGRRVAFYVVSGLGFVELLERHHA